MFPLKIAMAYLSEDKAVPEAFVTDVRAAVSNCDSVAPITWDRACEDLEDTFRVDCTGMRYIEQEEEDPTQEEEEGETLKPPPKAFGTAGGGGGHACQGQKSEALWSWYSHTNHPPSPQRDRQPTRQ